MNTTNTVFLLASAILKNKEDRILFLKRSDNHKTFKGHWQLPEGKVEFGEHPADALTREINEETGLVVRSSGLKSIASCAATIDNQGYQLIRILYEVTYEGKINLSGEHVDFCWATLDEAKKLEPKIAGLVEILEDLSK